MLDRCRATKVMRRFVERSLRFLQHRVFEVRMFMESFRAPVQPPKPIVASSQRPTPTGALVDKFVIHFLSSAASLENEEALAASALQGVSGIGICLFINLSKGSASEWSIYTTYSTPERKPLIV